MGFETHDLLHGNVVASPSTGRDAPEARPASADGRAAGVGSDGSAWPGRRTSVPLACPLSRPSPSGRIATLHRGHESPHDRSGGRAPADHRRDPRVGRRAGPDVEPKVRPEPPGSSKGGGGRSHGALSLHGGCRKRVALRGTAADVQTTTGPSAGPPRRSSRECSGRTSARLLTALERSSQEAARACATGSRGGARARARAAGRAGGHTHRGTRHSCLRLEQELGRRDPGRSVGRRDWRRDRDRAVAGLPAMRAASVSPTEALRTA